MSFGFVSLFLLLGFDCYCLNHGVVISFSIDEFDCPYGIFRPSFT